MSSITFNNMGGSGFGTGLWGGETVDDERVNKERAHSSNGLPTPNLENCNGQEAERGSEAPPAPKKPKTSRTNTVVLGKLFV